MMKGRCEAEAEKSRHLSSLMLPGFDCLRTVTLASLSDLGRIVGVAVTALETEAAIGR
jgi:hypothetical protein